MAICIRDPAVIAEPAGEYMSDNQETKIIEQPGKIGKPRSPAFFRR